MSSPGSAVLERPSELDNSDWYVVTSDEEASGAQMELSRGTAVPWLFEVVNDRHAYRIQRATGRRTEELPTDDSVNRVLGDPLPESKRPRHSGFKPRN